MATEGDVADAAKDVADDAADVVADAADDAGDAVKDVADDVADAGLLGKGSGDRPGPAADLDDLVPRRPDAPFSSQDWFRIEAAPDATVLIAVRAAAAVSVAVSENAPPAVCTETSARACVNWRAGRLGVPAQHRQLVGRVGRQDRQAFRGSQLRPQGLRLLAREAQQGAGRRQRGGGFLVAGS